MTRTTDLDTRTDLTSFADVVRQLAADRPDYPFATFCTFDGSDAATSASALDSAASAQREELTYTQLLRRAAGVAELLRAQGLDGPVAIMCPQGAEFLIGLVGCLLAGRIAIPLHPHEPGRPDSRIVSAINDADSRIVLTTTEHLETTDQVLAGRPGTVVHAVDTLPEGDPDAVDTPRPAPGDVAYLQYTSGSTRTPAGVRVTQGNLMIATAQLNEAIQMGPDSRFVAWLPFFHDMGVMFALTSLRLGARATYLSPRQFVERPGRWLGLLSTERATHGVTPNFGLEMCVTRVRPQDRAGLDLSALSVLVNGSEPIRRGTLITFANEYAEHGFRGIASKPGYGLAEATLTVSCTTLDQQLVAHTFDRDGLREGRVVRVDDGTPGGVELVGCGPVANQDARIVDPQERTEVPSGRVGEIWVSGGNVCDGYWNRPEVSAEMFDAELTDRAGERSRGWLRTEDLGFFHEDQLYIVARLKDLVIIDGQNHYPADVEATLKDAVTAATRTAAFSVDTGERERLVVALELPVQEVSAEELRTLRRTVRRAVAESHGLNVHDVAFVRRGGLPRTTSGKVQRHACQQLYQDGQLPLLDTPTSGSTQ
jgi:acyl-CoA synthetase (AMP-forming)/AMP-acid ligase II